MIKESIHTIWLDCKSEVLFAIALGAAVVLCCWGASVFLGDEQFVRNLLPAHGNALAILCLFGAYLCIRHYEGNRLRLAWAIALLLWGVLDTALLNGVFLADIPFFKSPNGELTAEMLLVSDVFFWILFTYPSEALSPPDGLHWKRALMLFLPLPVLAVADFLLPVDLRVLIGLYPVGLLVEFIVHMRTYNKWCEDNFSSMDDIDAQWITRYIIMLVVVEALQIWIWLSQEPTRFFTQELFFIFMVAYTTERVLFRPDPWKLMRSTAPEEEAEEELSEQPFAAYRATLEAWIEQEKPYLNPDFQLTDLRAVLPLNRTYLSQLINTEYGCSFYHWVNTYRIDEAKRLMRECPDLPMQDVSKQCGFSSPTVFSRVFAREAGLSPREWVSKIDNS